MQWLMILIKTLNQISYRLRLKKEQAMDAIGKVQKNM